jgi:VanZ family protein
LVKPYVWPFNFKNRLKQILFIVIYCLVLGLFIELIQHFFIYGRQGDIVDFTADLVGLTIGIVCFIIKKNYLN